MRLKESGTLIIPTEREEEGEWSLGLSSGLENMLGEELAPDSVETV
jgi:hypothetical protein